MWLKVCGKYNIPVGAGTYDRIIHQYPEHFPKEINKEKKWDAISKSVHDAHDDELKTELEKLPKYESSGYKGLVYYVLHPDEYDVEKEKRWNEIFEIEKKVRKRIWNKHYKKLGFTSKWL